MTINFSKLANIEFQTPKFDNDWIGFDFTLTTIAVETV